MRTNGCSMRGNNLTFEVVGSRGREWWTRLVASALALALPASPALAQSSTSFLDLAPDLVSKIVADLAPAASIRLAFAGDERVRAEVSRLLAGRGFRIVDGGDAAMVNGSCQSNLRERVCAASIVRGDTRRVVMATRALAAGGPDTARDAVVGMELRPIYTQQGPMLDVAEVNAQLLVLSPDAVSLVGDTSGGNVGARAIASRPIKTSRVWPRDLRGALRVGASGFEAFLPGVTCRGTAQPFTLSCADESEPWPIGLDNSGLTPSRNTFATPEGLTFYEAAPLGAGRWLVVGEQGILTFLDARRSVVARTAMAEHAAGFADGCGGDGPYIVTSARGSQPGIDMLRLSRPAADRLVALPSALVLQGTLTSLWTAPTGRSATAIVHDVNAGRYEAFHLTLSCAR